jgi:hypothetical protein
MTSVLSELTRKAGVKAFAEKARSLLQKKQDEKVARMDTMGRE